MRALTPSRAAKKAAMAEFEKENIISCSITDYVTGNSHNPDCINTD